MMPKGLSNLFDSNRGLLFVLSLSALLKLTIALSGGVINPDGDDYILAAQQIASGHLGQVLSEHAMPLFPILITIGQFFVSDWVLAAKLVSVISLVLAIIPLYLLTRDLFSRSAAFWGCLAFALAPFPNECAGEVIRGPAFLFCFAWAVYFSQRAIGSQRLIHYLGAALFAWVSVLFRIEGIILLPYFMLFLMGLVWFDRGQRRHLGMGLGVWIALPLLLFVVFLTATGFDALNLDKLNKFGRELRSIFQFRFLDNFHVVYDQLKELEALSPHPSGRHNFAEIARDFMPVIYLIGLLQGFIKVMFPLFVLPLFWSLRSSLNRSRLLVLALVFSYLFMVYLSLITKDYFQGRFLLTPVFLLYPWVGAGMDRLYVLLKRSSRAPLYLFLFAALVFVPPIFKCAKLVWTQDDVIIRAGNWLSEKKAFASASIISTDSRVPFYAGRGKDFLHYRRKLYDQRYDALERIAQANGMEVIVARTSKKDRKSIPKMQNYRKVKEFTGKRDVVIFYAKPEG